MSEREPWMERPGNRIMGHFGRICGWPYSEGPQVYPWPPRAGLWEEPPSVYTLTTPDADPTGSQGMVCTTAGIYLLVASFPQAQWTTPDEVPGNDSTHARLASWAMNAYTGRYAEAPEALLRDPLVCLEEVGVAWKVLDLTRVHVGRWAAVQGWARSWGHLFLVFRVEADLWLVLESNGPGVRRRWLSTKDLTDTYTVSLVAGVLRKNVPERLRRPEED